MEDFERKFFDDVEKIREAIKQNKILRQRIRNELFDVSEEEGEEIKEGAELFEALKGQKEKIGQQQLKLQAKLEQHLENLGMQQQTKNELTRYKTSKRWQKVQAFIEVERKKIG